ncbi:transposase [Pseudomonas sp. PDM15]|uniref:transposase n=1 Tax=Pseudomonas sp. PDM15 TaxID=2769303 RepID=UPI001784C60B|nr:transposase [Pseudomonas sp. PDM15]MBD9428251.1 transposase [Pseudomonas sp. PDM15]
MNDSVSARFDEFLDLEKIRQLVTVTPDALRSLESLDALVAADTLEKSLKAIYLPNDFILGFIKEMYAKAAHHSEWLFSNEAEYIARIYNPPATEIFPVCLTGLAGVGKSQAISALQKVLPSPFDFECAHFQGCLSLVSYWSTSARGKAGGRQMLADLIGANGGNASKLLVECRRRANRDGVSLALLDETQHINTGQGASKVTEILLTMAAIGPPMIFVSNYSLIHKLNRRNAEDKHRLLSEPRIMHPDDPGSGAWNSYIVECFRVAGDRVKGSVDEFAQEIYRSTFGIKRSVVHILKQAYIAARGAGREYLTVGDISKAYHCPAYAAYKNDVEILQLIALQGPKARNRLDLICPFNLPATSKSNVVAFVRGERESKVINNVFESSLTEAERSGLEKIKSDQTTPPRPKSPRMPRLPEATIDDLASAFLEDVSAPPTKP